MNFTMTAPSIAVAAAALGTALFFGYAIAMLCWTALVRFKVLRNTDCLDFRGAKVKEIAYALEFWRGAALIQRRCAQNGHSGCAPCSQSVFCDMGRCDGCTTMVPSDAQWVSICMRNLSGSQWDEVIPTVYRALKQTETMEDVVKVFKETESVSMRNYLIRQPHSAFIARCQELVNEDNRDLPFAVKWEFAQDAAHQKKLMGTVQ